MNVTSEKKIIFHHPLELVFEPRKTTLSVSDVAITSSGISLNVSFRLTSNISNTSILLPILVNITVAIRDHSRYAQKSPWNKATNEMGTGLVESNRGYNSSFQRFILVLYHAGHTRKVRTKW